jgi:hypothetical protein
MGYIFALSREKNSNLFISFVFLEVRKILADETAVGSYIMNGFGWKLYLGGCESSIM